MTALPENIPGPLAIDPELASMVGALAPCVLWREMDGRKVPVDSLGRSVNALDPTNQMSFASAAQVCAAARTRKARVEDQKDVAAWQVVEPANEVIDGDEVGWTSRLRVYRDDESALGTIRQAHGLAMPREKDHNQIVGSRRTRQAASHSMADVRAGGFSVQDSRELVTVTVLEESPDPLGIVHSVPQARVLGVLVDADG
jgi:hypothetical protein